MTKPIILAVLGAAALGIFPEVATTKSGNDEQVFDRSKGPRGGVLRAGQGSDLVLEEAQFVVEDSGRVKLSMGGSMVPGRPFHFMWVVDIAKGTYYTFELNDPEGDAKRLYKFFNSYGVTVTEESLKGAFRRAHAGQQHAMAEWRKSTLTTTIGSLGSAIGSAASEVDTCGAPSDKPSLDSCEGSGYARVQVWEPARYIFDVAHLAETNTTASWTRNTTLGIVHANSNGWCWYNTLTFALTQWFQESCDKTHTPYSNSFDATTLGIFYNYDFGLDVDSIEVITTASVQYTYGGPHWGQSFQYINYGLSNFYEGFLLSGIPSGLASEYHCADLCGVDEETVENCPLQQDNHEWDWDTCECVLAASPILIDVDGDGLELTNATDGVRFDIAGNGSPLQLGWSQARARDAFLVLDRNGNGQIDNGTELFGNFTRQPQPPRGENKNGFLALAAFDAGSQGGNEDGVISAADAVFANLKLWFDGNHDGVSQLNELIDLVTGNVRNISLDYRTRKKIDEHGNRFRYWSEVGLTAGRVRAVDVYFVYSR